MSVTFVAANVRVMKLAQNFGHEDEGASASTSSPYADPEDSELVAKAKQQAVQSMDYSYTERDVILYNLGVGATEKELQWTFEGDDEFQALPTFGVIPQFRCMFTLPLDWLPDFNPVSVPKSCTRCDCGSFTTFRLSCCTESNTCLSRLPFPPAGTSSARLGKSAFSGIVSFELSSSRCHAASSRCWTKERPLRLPSLSRRRTNRPAS